MVREKNPRCVSWGWVTQAGCRLEGLKFVRRPFYFYWSGGRDSREREIRPRKDLEDLTKSNLDAELRERLDDDLGSKDFKILYAPSDADGKRTFYMANSFPAEEARPVRAQAFVKSGMMAYEFLDGELTGTSQAASLMKIFSGETANGPEVDLSIGLSVDDCRLMLSVVANHHKRSLGDISETEEIRRAASTT